MATSLSTTGPPSNMIPWAHSSPQPKQQIDRFSRFRTAHSIKCLYFTWAFSPKIAPFRGGWGHPFRWQQSVLILYNGFPFPKNCPFPRGISTSMQDTIPWTHPSPQTKRHLYPFSRLSTDNHRMSLYLTMEGLFSPKNLSLPMGDLNPHVIHGPFGPPKSSTQTASRSVQPFLQGSLV